MGIELSGTNPGVKEKHGSIFLKSIKSMLNKKRPVFYQSHILSATALPNSAVVAFPPKSLVRVFPSMSTS